MSGETKKDSGNIVHQEDLEWREVTHGEKFHLLGKSFTVPSGAQELGCGLFRLPPGKRSFPEHYHMGVEEAIFILKGEGTLVGNGREQIVGEGTFISFPRGEDYSHQMYNHTDQDLDYLCMSTLNDPDVVLYPNSSKMGVWAGVEPGGNPWEAKIRKIFYPQEADYFEGEE